MKYRIVKAGTLAQLETVVQVMIEDGWKPYGSIVLDHEAREWGQPMTRSETLKS